MDYAAEQLKSTDKKLIEVAFDCGLNSIAYFHRLFLLQHGMPPHQYRLYHQRTRAKNR